MISDVQRLIARNGGGLQGLARLAAKSTRVLLLQGPREFALRLGRSRTMEYRLPPIDSGMETIGPAIEPEPLGDATVDIVICVHNALVRVQSCLESIRPTLGSSCRVIVVDDGSADATREYLESFTKTAGWKLIRHEQAVGYPRAANEGMTATTADFVVLLNSDTEVSREWLERLVMCARSDPSIGMVGPLSNAASWQSVPAIESNGDWATNSLPVDMSLSDVARAIGERSGRSYPRVGVLNGFCLLIKRAVIDEVGLFDLGSFGSGYGEENDLCLRARKNGWDLAIADDVYVYHHQTSSYTLEERLLRSKAADLELRRKHGEDAVNAAVSSCRDNPILAAIREKHANSLERYRCVERARKRFGGMTLSFVLPTAEPSGGANVVLLEALAMQRMGIDVEIVNLEAHRSRFEYVYGRNPVRRRYFKTVKDLIYGISDRDAVVGTLYTTMEWVAKFGDTTSNQTVVYYIQDFEPYFFDPTELDYELAMRSYTLIPTSVLIAKTDWTRRKVYENTGVNPSVIGPSVDLDLFTLRHPRRAKWPEGPLRVAAMLRPSTPRRAPQFTVDVLKEVERSMDRTLEVVVFGGDGRDPELQTLGLPPSWRNEGVLRDVQLAGLLAEVDLFVDLSAYQAMGLTALEALSSGVPVVVPTEGGTDAFAHEGYNAAIANTAVDSECVDAILRVLNDDDVRDVLASNARTSVSGFAGEYVAARFLKAVVDDQMSS